MPEHWGPAAEGLQKTSDRIQHRNRSAAALNQTQVSLYLKSLGYSCRSVKPDLEILKSHLQHQQFPHEIGLFLGYDYEDVIGFTQHQGQDYLYKGYWKVYHEVEQKKQLFHTYSECRKQYLKQYKEGIPLGELFY